jgi:uncharacterized Zn finger protein (UPF0148 family)
VIRLLYSKCGQPYCPHCDIKLKKESEEKIKDFEKRMGKKPTSASLREQLDFMMYEMKSSPEYYGLNRLKQAKTAKDASMIFESKFERPAVNAESTRSRINSANKVLGEMNAKTSTIGQIPNNATKMSIPKNPSIFSPSSTPLKNIAAAADASSSPTIIMPQTTNINAPATNVSGGGSGGSQVVSVRDSTNSLTRNADKNTGFGFARNA